MNVSRYHRQELLPQVGAEGQRRLLAARVLVVGCGALGSVAAEQLVRAGVGFVRIVDRDIVEWTNLQRQVLFDESDARDGLPKAVAAQRRLRQINSSVQVEGVATDVHSGNIEALAGVDGRSAPVQVIVDGTDNVETRYLLNDLAVKHGVPWVYGACIGVEGRVMAIRPGEGPCLRCVFPDPPDARSLPTCDTAGVLGPAAGVVANLEAASALRLLVGEQWDGQMVVLDVWRQRFRSIDTGERRIGCPACDQRRFDFLDAAPAGGTATLCGRNAVQVRPSGKDRLDLPAVSQRLQSAGECDIRPFFVRCRLREMEGVTLTVFPDGRMIAQGVDDPSRARSLYARYVGQ